MLITARPMGAGTVALLLMTGVAVLASRLLGQNRRLAAVMMTILLTPAYHVLLSVILVLTQNSPFDFQPTVILIAAFMNGIVAFLLATLFGAIEHRFGTVERSGVDW
jgi:hypothetical protein